MNILQSKRALRETDCPLGANPWDETYAAIYDKLEEELRK